MKENKIKILHTVIKYPITIISTPIQLIAIALAYIALSLKSFANALIAISDAWGEYLIKKLYYEKIMWTSIDKTPPVDKPLLLRYGGGGMNRRMDFGHYTGSHYLTKDGQIVDEHVIAWVEVEFGIKQ